MNFFRRLRLAWRVLYYRGPWLPRYSYSDEPTLFDYPLDVAPSFPAPGSDQEVGWELMAKDFPLFNRIPHSDNCKGMPLCDWKPIVPFVSDSALPEGTIRVGDEMLINIGGQEVCN